MRRQIVRREAPSDDERLERARLRPRVIGSTMWRSDFPGGTAWIVCEEGDAR
jgi:hypothetical protein